MFEGVQEGIANEFSSPFLSFFPVREDEKQTRRREKEKEEIKEEEEEAEEIERIFLSVELSRKFQEFAEEKIFLPGKEERKEEIERRNKKEENRRKKK